jgi:hypothetical protein
MIINGVDLSQLGVYLAIDTASPSGLVWLKAPKYSRIVPGQPAFTTKTARGYYQGKLLGKCLLAHRVVLYLATGEFPDAVDHVDGNPSNNHPDNLRPCDPQTNAFNSGKRVGNRSGYKGVYAHGNAWVARIRLGGKAVNLGRFNSPELASAAYVRAAKEAHGDFYCSRN